MAYLLDANVSIEAKNRYYSFDFCPAFWDWMIAKNAEDQVFSIKEAGNKSESGGNDLPNWIGEFGDLVKPIPEVLGAFGRVDDWAITQNYAFVAVKTFMEAADCFVAHAFEGGHEVVTFNILFGSKKRIKIPNACIALGVKRVTPFELLRRERARFALGEAA